MNKFFVMGDIHGHFQPIRDFVLRNKLTENFDGSDTMILLGDAGLNFFFNYRDEKFKEQLGKYPFTYFVIRGNHEERPSICAEKYPDKWHQEKYMGGIVWVENKYPYIKYAMDYVSWYLINNYITVVIPGAYSIDKYKRLQKGWSWFPNEQLSEEEKKNGINLLISMQWNCDLVLSHTCPCIYEPTDLFLSFVDQSMVEKDMERYLGIVERGLDYKAWMWGHYHAFRDYPRDDGKKKLMLFNDYVINLEDYIEKNEVIKL